MADRAGFPTAAGRFRVAFPWGPGRVRFSISGEGEVLGGIRYIGWLAAL